MKKQKLKFMLVLATVVIGMFIICGKVNASTGATIFIGEPVILEDYTDVEITYNNVEIDEETSEVKNTQLFTNLSDKTITRKASIKLEDSYSNLTINSLKIVVNNLEITEITKEGDNYIFYFQILPNEGKKIEVSYKTDSNLQDAKIIKYTMDKIKGQKVKLFDISVKLSKYDIPLVQKIWPGAYEFENNTVSTEYVDFTVNNLTSAFIMQKETYKNLKYGEYAESLSDIDEYILQHAKEFIDGNTPTISDRYFIRNDIARIVKGREFNYGEDEINSALETVLNYSLIMKAYNENNVYYTNEYGDLSLTADFRIPEDYCLANLINSLYTKEIKAYGNYDDQEYKIAAGKMVAINYYETEQEKDLYVNKDIKNLAHSVDGAEFVLKKRDEYSILRTIVASGGPITSLNEGTKKVFVNSDIDGNKIDISEEEIIQFVNMMNVDLYIRIVLYDPSSQYPDVMVGYYTDNGEKIAREYIEMDNVINEYQKIIYELEDGSYYKYHTPTEEEKQEEIAKYKEWIEKIKIKYKKFDNDVVKNNSKIPTIAHCVGKCEYKDGKYVIEFNNTGDESGLGYIYGATECDAAKRMLAENKANNNAIREKIVNQISSAKITTDSEEYKKPKELISISTENIEEAGLLNGIVELIRNDNRYLMLASIGGLAIILIIMLIILIIRRNKNGRKKI